MALHFQNDNAQTLTTTAETVVGSCVSPGFMPTQIRGMVNVTAGTGTTAIVLRVRAGINAVAGALVGVAQTDTLAAGSSEAIAIFEYDPTGVTTGYTITAQQTGATGNGTVNSVSLDIETQ